MSESGHTSPPRAGARGTIRDFGDALRDERLRRALADDPFGFKRRRLIREGAFGAEAQAQALAADERSALRWRSQREGTHCAACLTPFAEGDVVYRPMPVERRRDAESGAYYERTPLCAGCVWKPLLEVPPEPCEGCGRPVVQASRFYRESRWDEETGRLLYSHTPRRVYSARSRGLERPRCACSERCARRRPAPEARPCAACGEPFTPKRADARTCSDRCRKALSRMAREERDADG